jgi:TonB-linked SusC/RagA family outer membrane protein
MLSQNAKIKIVADDVLTVNEVFEMIMKQTDYNFIYEDKIFKDFPKIAVKKGTISLNKLVNETLSGKAVNIILTQNNTILIKEANTQQQQQVTGKVTDAANLPVPGVTVLIKGTAKGTVTDLDGNYNITVPNPENVLVFTSLGFEKQEITVGSQSVINVTLKEAVATLEEVTINAGYYKTSRKLSTGSIGSVKAKAIGQQPVTDPIESLKGKIAGLQITQESGLPGAASTVRIRGINSLNRGANLLLYILNGIPIPSKAEGSLENGVGISPLEYLNTADIESIDVLKDADATAIYGSRGANGVILITTKKGQAGKAKIDVDFSHGILKLPNLDHIKLLNTTEYLAMRKQTAINEGIWPITQTSGYYFNNNIDLVEWDPNRDIDWRKVLLGGIGEQNKGRLSASGGTENTSFLFSLNLSKQTNIFNYDDSAHKQASSSLTVNHKSKDNGFHASFTSRYSITQNNQNTGATDNYFRSAFTLAPNAPDFFDEDGNIDHQGTSYYRNPLAELERTQERDTRNFTGSITLGYNDVIPNVDAKVLLGYSSTHNNNIKLIPLSSYKPSTNPASNKTDLSVTNSWNIEPEISYKKSIGPNKFILQVGASFQSTTAKTIGVTGSGYTTDLLLQDLSVAPNKYINHNSSQYKYNAIYTRLNYNYDNKYLLNLTGRRDGSSRFGPGNQWGNFGAIGTAWIFSSEEFIKDKLSFLSFGKLRGSYGITGNDQIGNYQYLSTYRNYGSQTYNGVTILIPSRSANPNYSWEENKKLEIALDLGLFSNKISLEAAWYKNQSSNQLIGLPLSTVTGFSSQQFNLPALVENRGLELTVNTVNMSNKNFRWTSSFNISREKNELKDFPNIENFPAFDNLYVVGKSLYGTKRYESTGVNPATGIYDITDLDQNGSINVFDRQFFVDTAPEFYGGFGNSLTYKNWELDLAISFKKQQGLDFSTNFTSPGMFDGGHGNLPIEFLDNWVNPGDKTKFQQFNYETTNDYYYAAQQDASSTRHITDRSFIKLQNISLTYNLSKKTLENIGFSAAKFYIQGQNLLTITPYKGIDPEIGGFALPPLRTIITGVQLTF